MALSPARAAAFEILMRIETTDAYASELLHSSRFTKLSPADHGLLTELVMGVLRWRGVLDNRIAELYRRSSENRSLADRSASRKISALVANNATRTGHPERSLAKLDLEVLTALRLGAYQILFLDRVPRHAAVNESVELVKTAHKRSAAGLVNAVLRRIDKAPSDFSDRSAHPDWLVERWTRIYGQDITRKICEYNQSAPKAVVRMTSTPSNVGTAALGCPVKRSSMDYSTENDPGLRPGGQPGAAVPTFEELCSEGIQIEPGKLLSTAFTVKSGDITRTKAFRERRLIIQDEASQLVALLVGHGKNILDCCAAPGGKTRIIAERNPQAKVVAMDLHPRRAAILRKLVTARNVHVIAADARNMPFGGNLDRILVDAPCSGTGTLARNPEIKWRLKPEDLPRLRKYQTEILLSAMQHLAPAGRIVYSTCSLEPEENSEVVELALAANPSFRLVNCRDELQKLQASDEVTWEQSDSLLSGPYLRTIPGAHPCDGFFATIIARE